MLCKKRQQDAAVYWLIYLSTRVKNMCEVACVTQQTTRQNNLLLVQSIHYHIMTKDISSSILLLLCGSHQVFHDCGLRSCWLVGWLFTQQPPHCTVWKPLFPDWAHCDGNTDSYQQTQVQKGHSRVERGVCVLFSDTEKIESAPWASGATTLPKVSPGIVSSWFKRTLCAHGSVPRETAIVRHSTTRLTYTQQTK